MSMLFTAFAGYFVLEEWQTFYENMLDEQVKYFIGGNKIEQIQEEFRVNLQTMAMTSKEIVNAFDFSDDELLTALGKKDYKDQDEMYSEIMRVVRLNPLNKKPVPTGFNRYMRPIILGKL